MYVNKVEFHVMEAVLGTGLDVRACQHDVSRRIYLLPVTAHRYAARSSRHSVSCG